jgi:uncharacterized protein
VVQALSVLGGSGLDAPSLVKEIRELLGSRQGNLAANLIGFARLLRVSDFDVTAGRVIDAARSLAEIDAGNPEDFRLALQANFVSDASLFPLFDQLFMLYWRTGGVPRIAEGPPSGEQSESRGSGRSDKAHAAPLPAYAPEGENPEATAGASDLLTAKDFTGFQDTDVRRARRLIRALAPKLATVPSRRTRTALRGGSVDLRRSLRRSVRHGGEVIDLLRRRRRVRRLRIVLLCDVSGSMDVYARYLVQFLYAMQNELRGVSTFVFSTRLNEITQLLKTRDFDEALSRISADVESWSGGTSIGRCLAQFDRDYARRRVDARTVLMIISDGWERGDVEQLRRAMTSLKRRSYKVMWLNPLLASRDYRPLARGMAAALPFTDYFLPAHNLDSLVRVAHTLERLGRG